MYQHGKRTKRKTNPRVYLHASFVLGIALIVGAYILHKDLSVETNEKSGNSIVTEVKADGSDVTKISEDLFSMELPSDWKQTNRVQESYANYYEWRSTKKGADDRLLRLHIDTMPQDYKLVRLQPLTPNGNKFMLGNVSGNCVDFANGAAGRQSTIPVPAKWEGITFVCDPISANQTIGTGSLDGGGIITSLGRHRYFFYYEDHNIRPDDKILINTLRSFTVN